jgi:hypothetical protein
MDAVQCESGALSDLERGEPRVVALTVRELRTGAVLVSSLLVFTLASLASLYDAVGAALQHSPQHSPQHVPARLVLARGALVPRDPDVLTRALQLAHHDVLLCTHHDVLMRTQSPANAPSVGSAAGSAVGSALSSSHGWNSGSASSSCIRCCARCDRALTCTAPVQFRIASYAAAVCGDCVHACPSSLRRRLVRVHTAELVRDGIFSTCRPDLVWMPRYESPAAWLTARAGPYAGAVHVLQQDVARGAVAVTSPDKTGLVWLWPP